MPNYERITSRRCAELAQQIRNASTGLGVTIPDNSHLEQIVSTLEWLGSYAPDSFQPDAAHEDDPARALRGFWSLDLAQRIAAAMTLAQVIPGSQSRISLFRKALDRTLDPEAKALDLFFELEIATRLMERFIPVKFEEPDLSVGLLGKGSVSIACKRPRKLESVPAAIRKGARQVKEQGRGLVVVNLDLLLHSSNDPARPYVTYHVPTPEHLLRLQPKIDEAAAYCERAIHAAFWKGLWGVLFCACATGFADRVEEGYAGFIYRWLRKPVSSFDGAAEMLDEMIFAETGKIRGCMSTPLL